jgi:hypothetical protein
VRLVLESAENGDRRCLVVIDGGPPNMDGCRSADSADRWKTPLDRSLQSQASGKYLTAVAGERATLSATPQRIALDAVR